MRNVVLIAAVLSGAVAAAAPTGRPITTLLIVEGHDLRFDHLPLGVDPSHLRITALVQDDLGFLWIGTDNGLKRYDGYRFRDYGNDPKDPNHPAGSYVIALFKDRSGKIWVASGRSLDIYDPVTEKFTPFRAEPGSQARFTARIGEINQDRAGTIWLATDRGLFGVGAEGVRVHYRHDAADVNSLSGDIVRSALETRNGEFWVATDEGIDAVDRASRKVERRIPFAMPHSPYSKLLEDHAGVMWLTYSADTYPGLATVDRAANALRHYRVVPQDAKAYPSTRTIYEDADGNLWILTSQGGLFRLDRERTRFVRYRNEPHDASSVASDQLSVIFEDREGSVWLGTISDGLDRFTRKPLPFRRYAQELRDPVNAAIRDSHGFVWIGGARSLVKLDPQTGNLTHYRSQGTAGPGELTNSRIASLAEDRSGDLWIGTQGGGLNLLKMSSGRFQVYRHDKKNPSSIDSDAVSSLYVDRSGVLWAGTEEGLNSFDPRTESFHVYPAPAKPSVYRRITEDSRGRLWLSSASTGVHRFDPATGTFHVYRRSDAPGALKSDAVTAVCVDRSGTVWVGTNVGLHILDPDTGQTTVFNSDPPMRRIDSILEDSRGDLWMGTDNGLAHFDPRAKTFRRYHSSDGLAANETGGTAAWKSPEGEMYFGSQGGLTVFDPAAIVDDSTAPVVRLTDIQILGKPVAVGPNSPLDRSISSTNSLRLTHAQNTFSLEFSALTFADPGRSRYRYRLEPIEKEWTEVDGARRWVTYAALPAGEYLLRVLGGNSRGVWNQDGVRLAISVSPPWWSTAWFRIVCVALVLVTAWAFLQLRLRQQAHEFDLRLEERIDERTRIARELHDTLLQSFQALAIILQAARNQFARHPAEALRLLDEAIDEAGRAVGEGRETIRGMRSSTSNTNELATAIREAGENYASEGSPIFRVMVEGTMRNVNPMISGEVYRIACEAIRNAFLHAEAKVIETDIAFGDELRLRIRDDGKGIDPATLKEGRVGHYGLPGMRERAARIGGTLRVWSAPGAGSEIELSVPGAISFDPSARQPLRSLFRRKHKAAAE